MNLRYPEFRQRGEYSRETPHRLRLDDEVDLAARSRGVFRRHLMHHAAVIRRYQPIDEFGDLHQHVEIGNQRLLQIGPLNLDGDLRSAGAQSRAIHLSDGRRGYGFVRKLREYLRQLPTELALNEFARFGSRKRRNVRPQLPELAQERVTEQVHPGCEQLPELHERRTEPFERSPETRRALRVSSLVTARNPASLDRFWVARTETFLQKYPGDFRNSAEVHDGPSVHRSFAIASCGAATDPIESLLPVRLFE